MRLLSRPPRPRRAPDLRPLLPGPQLVLPIHWTEREEYQKMLLETARMSKIEGQRERQLIAEAEHEVELRHLREKAELLERLAAAQKEKA